MKNVAEVASNEPPIGSTLISSFQNADYHDQPYPHWYAKHCLPSDVVARCLALPFEAPDHLDISGRRELHNKTRQYFDTENQQKFPVCREVADALQDKKVTNLIETFFSINLKGSYLRIEYAQDIDGFWLEPHTDIGVKLFTMLLYISTNDQHSTLGTDIYDENSKHVGRSPFASNSALIFIPADNTFHGFEKRSIEGVRKSIIINYVTEDWRAREQLAFPDQPIS